MKSTYFFIKVVLIALTAGLLSCQPKSKVQALLYQAPNFPSREKIEASKSSIETFFYLAQGCFIKHEDSRDVVIYHNVPVFTNRWGEYWLYSEGSMPNLLEEPFDQSVMNIIKHGRDSLDIYFYRIKNKERFNLGWYDTQKLKELSLDDLIEENNNDCNGIVEQVEKTIFKQQDKGLCKNEGAISNRTYSRTTIIFSLDGMCIKSDWYDDNRNLKASSSLPDSCDLFYRDLTYKYHKVIYDQRLKNHLSTREKAH